MSTQLLLPIIPGGSTPITDILSVWRDEDRWTYFMGMNPLYSHAPSNLKLFRIITSILIDSGSCRPIDIINTFSVAKSNVLRALKLYRSEGIDGFYKTRKTRIGGSILTPNKLAKAQQLLCEHVDRHEIAKELDVPYDTLRKAISSGRLKVPSEPSELQETAIEIATSKSERDRVDYQAAEGMGTACVRVDERAGAAFGVCDGAVTRFEPCLDVPNGGALVALPALLANGLMEGSEKMLGGVNGYYKCLHILLTLAFMGLCRIKSVEKLRGHAPGEFGKMLGLDRAPEARCMRDKMDELSAGEAAEKWALPLSKFWMDANPAAAGVLYIDGHVQVYHGGLTKLPRQFVSREKLCLRGITDFWVNDTIGRPFFVVQKVVDAGLLDVLRSDIVPRLLLDVPKQPTEEELAANKNLCRFVMVFDREGYSPEFFREMWETHRIACITYHKYPKEIWSEDCFKPHEVSMPSGEIVTLQLAEKETMIGTGKKSIRVREVRKLTATGHQTSIVSTCYEGDQTLIASRMFTRWCQENFFRYMIQHYEIDHLSEYGTEAIVDTQRVVNPAWRELTRSVNSIKNKLRYKGGTFAAMALHPENEEKIERYKKWLAKKATALEEIQCYEHEIVEKKVLLETTPHYITWAELEEKDRFTRLLPARKRLFDTVKMIAYRAETAMGSLLLSPTVDFVRARTLLQNIFVAAADILPDPDNKILLVRVHSASRPADNRAFEQLFTNLNEAQVTYPGTNLRLFYELSGSRAEEVLKVSTPLPAGKDL